MEDYIKREQIGGVSPRHLKTFFTWLLLLCTTHNQSMLCIVLLLPVPMYTMLSTTKQSEHTIISCCFC